MEGIETNLEKEMPAFRGTGPFLFCYRLAWKSEDYYPLDKTGENVQRVLVLNLAKISKDFLIFISTLLKITETRFDSEPFVTCE